MSVIERPAITYNDPSHTYTIDGEELLGISTVAKIGGAEDTWGIASAWGFRIGYEGAFDILRPDLLPDLFCEVADTKDGLRSTLRERGLTPWAKREEAADRGTWVHDVLEKLAQDGSLPSISTFSDEVRGHVQALCHWYLNYLPEFVATEVQVASVKYGFAGRYDIRCKIPTARIMRLFDGHESFQADGVACIDASGPNETALCLVDLKTSKGVYPETHFPQLSGYEGASVEMGFPATDAQFVLNTHADGTYDFVPSWSTFDDFLGYLDALRAIRRIKNADPEAKLEREREEAILAHLPARSRELAEKLAILSGLDGKAVGYIMSRLKKRGRVVSLGSGIWGQPPHPPASE